MRNQFVLAGIKDAALRLSQKTEDERNGFLARLAESIAHNKAHIRKENEKDVRAAEDNRLPPAFIQRLTMDEKGVNSLVTRVRELARLTSGLGRAIESRTLPNGILLKKVAVPLGVILVIYESRPEVTIDVAALCVKSGNAAILKGGSEAIHTNKALFKCVQEALGKAGLSRQTVQFIEKRQQVSDLLKRNDVIDLVVARGGYELVKKVTASSRIPVLAHAAGGARIYIDKSADQKIVNPIIINAKKSKPAACNALDTILVHKDVEATVLPSLIKKLQAESVRVLGDLFCKNTYRVEQASQKTWNTEFLGLTVAIKIVKNVDQAVGFINKYSKHHSEGIIAMDKTVISAFVNGLDTAVVFINCSTRFNDGYEFGLGAEMGIATGKLHARGPVGLRELTTYRWEAYGKGQIRS